MARRTRRQFTNDFKAEAVRLSRVGDRSIAQLARDLDVGENALREWVQKAGPVPEAAVAGSVLAVAEQQELKDLRREVETLREEREILKKAVAFFAKESR